LKNEGEEEAKVESGVQRFLIGMDFCFCQPTVLQRFNLLLQRLIKPPVFQPIIIVSKIMSSDLFEKMVQEEVIAQTEAVKLGGGLPSFGKFMDDILACYSNLSFRLIIHQIILTISISRHQSQS
jgi:hypothetical protein